jgi:HJR/Mrr/RecB family endonuclease/superfamily II DNA or RNA helicase
MTGWLRGELMALPQVASLFTPLKFPAAAGKSYGERKTEDPFTTSGKVSFAPSEEDLTEECIHGIRRAWCEFCAEAWTEPRSKGTATPKRPVIDPFDIIFPILQPPLGKDFDNVLVFPPGKRLYPFQCEGVQFLVARTSALLGDEMGLGKSIQAIFALRILFREGSIRKVLLLCPKSVLYDWYYKFWEWSPELRVLRVRASPQEREILWDTSAHIYLTTYDTLRNDIEKVKVSSFDVCLLDEMQYIKNPGAGVTQAARRINARLRWGLTGTPLENKVEDVVSLFAYLKPGLLRMADADRPSFVKRKIAPHFLRRRAADVLQDLPPKVSHEVWLELGSCQRETYDRLFHEGRTSLSQNRTVPHVLSLIGQLKQVCNLDPITGQSTKLEYLREQLEELVDNEEKALVFSQYPEKTLREIEPDLTDFEPQLFHGQLSDRERDRVVREFQEQDYSKVLLMSVRAGGVGLTLTRANHVFHFDLWWNPAIARQAEGRAHRIGQQKTVFVKTLYTVDTIEQRIHDLLAEKQALFQFVIDDLSDASLKSLLTEDELFGLFDLEASRPADGKRPSQDASEALQSLSPMQFEELIASLYERMGFHTRQTRASYDQGVDVFAKRATDAGVENLIIQCKHYSGDSVSVSAVRDLYGTLRSRPDVNRAVLVTSGRFSKPCYDFARGKSIDLIPLEQLVGLLEKYHLLDDLVSK